MLVALRRLAERGRAVEDDVLAGLAVLGEPVPQRTLDDWLDQAADTLRAVGEEAAAQERLLAPAGTRPDDRVVPRARDVPRRSW